MKGLGFEAGRHSFHLELLQGLELTASTIRTPMPGGRAIDVSLALYKKEDWLLCSAQYGGPPNEEYDASLGQLGFQARDTLGALLDRPHFHQWPARDRIELDEAAESIVSCIEGFLLPRLPEMESKAVEIISRGLIVAHEETEGAWLPITERCPYGPCGEMGRPVSGGGFCVETRRPDLDK